MAGCREEVEAGAEETRARPATPVRGVDVDGVDLTGPGRRILVATSAYRDEPGDAGRILLVHEYGDGWIADQTTP